MGTNPNYDHKTAGRYPPPSVVVLMINKQDDQKTMDFFGKVLVIVRICDRFLQVSQARLLAPDCQSVTKSYK
jgi:hypothetical protein